MVTSHCNTWRFSGDAIPTWFHILAVMDAYAARQTTLRIAHSGAWNDADLVSTSNFEISNAAVATISQNTHENMRKFYDSVCLEYRGLMKP